MPRVTPPPVYDTEPEKGDDGKWGRIVREPENNRYGALKILARADGLFTVFDTRQKLSFEHPVFDNEDEARDYAKKHWVDE